MPHQVLARKWRPQTFEALIGQSQARQALVNALEQQRLHHAYLFSGTRGVGKTTIARIFAKCLNCQHGITPQPCGQCDNCQAIDNGQLVDLIEVDAASRTKVDDTRQLLENAQYAPTRGRYKIYIIDEVHMLSTHSFNALLKTLEEPPEHVKFLLATTDPQRLPVTVLSRCLQFHLKLLSVAQISHHLATVAEAEGVQYEDPALQIIAQAAKGSLRDALSLLDQAIAFCQSHINQEQIQTMLGTIDESLIMALQHAVVANDTDQLINTIQTLANHGADFHQTLEQLASLQHRLAMLKHLPDQTLTPFTIQPGERDMAQRLSPECIQLFYQILIQSKSDLPQAPTPRSGFEMAMLRLMAFQPNDAPQSSDPSTSVANLSTNSHPPQSAHSSSFANYNAHQQKAAVGTPRHNESATASTQMTSTMEPSAATTTPAQQPQHNQQSNTVAQQATSLTSANWANLIASLDISGLTLQVAKHCELINESQGTIHLAIAKEFASMATERPKNHLAQALSKKLNRSVRVTITTQQQVSHSPAAIEQQQQQQAREHAQSALDNDSQFQSLVDTFDGQITDITPR